MTRAVYPELLDLATEDEYRSHYYNVYCIGPLPTFDGIQVRFRKSNFGHAFFESSSPQSKDDTFSLDRAIRMDWIKIALMDSGADLRYGYDNKLRQKDNSRRVAIVKGNYVVIIRLVSDTIAEFVTCFVATTPTLEKIRKSAKWPRKTSITHDEDDEQGA